MLEKVLEYKWHIIIVISSLIVLIVMYQVYSTNKKVNMLYKCINELGYRVEELSKAKPSQSQTQQPPRPLFKKPMKKVEAPSSRQREAQPRSPTVPQPRELPSLSPERRTKSQPLVNETIIFQVSQPMPQQQPVNASTIEEIDSDSEVEVEDVKMKDVDLDKALEAELSELNNEQEE
jgi:hypothetical protein